MKFIDFQIKFEELLLEKFPIEMEYIEIYPAPDDGGVLIYKLDDKKIKLHYDVRDQWFYVSYSKDNNWQEQFFATKKQLLGSKLKDIVDFFSNKPVPTDI